MEWFLKVVKEHYADFNGRARRKEYWMFVLIYVIISIVVSFVDILVAKVIGFGVLGIVLSLGLLVPSIAVAVRRLHDIGKSGWWILVGLVPIAGGIYLIYLLAQDSVPGDNEFGSNPKALEMA